MCDWVKWHSLYRFSFLAYCLAWEPATNDASSQSRTTTDINTNVRQRSLLKKRHRTEYIIWCRIKEMHEKEGGLVRAPLEQLHVAKQQTYRYDVMLTSAVHSSNCLIWKCFVLSSPIVFLFVTKSYFWNFAQTEPFEDALGLKSVIAIGKQTNDKQVN